MKILLVQLASMGDCLLVTPIARQIKEVDYPGCHLTWMIGKQYGKILLNNPYVDEIKEMLCGRDDRGKIPLLIASFKQHYDKIIITDFFKENYQHFYGTTRSALFRTYGKEITIPVEPLVYLSAKEVKHVASFASEHRLNDLDLYPILVEYSPQSRQSNLDFEMAKRVARKVSLKHPKARFIFSSNEKITDVPDNIIDASELSWRENAELTKYCRLLLGGSSGITWLNTSNWAAKIPMLQFLRSEYMWGVLSPSVELDFMYWGLPTDHLIEITDGHEDQLVDCLCEIIGQSFAVAKKSYPGRKHLSKIEIDNFFTRRLAQAFFSLPTIDPFYESVSAPVTDDMAAQQAVVLGKVKYLVKSNHYAYKYIKKLKALLVK